MNNRGNFDPSSVSPEVAALLVECHTRAFDPADVNVLRELFAQSVEYLTRHEYDEAQRLAWVTVAADGQAFQDRLWNGETLVAELDGDIAGFASLKDDGLIDMIYVHPHYAGRGVGRRLVAELEALAAARGTMALSVEASDTARGLFEHLGYVAKERRLVECEGQMLARTTMQKALRDEGHLSS